MQIGREGKNYFLKILPVKIQIHKHKRLENSHATAMFQVGKSIGKNVMRLIQFPAFKSHKSIKNDLTEEATTREAEEKKSTYISTLFRKPPNLALSNYFTNLLLRFIAMICS